jgi:hypothetical protein
MGLARTPLARAPAREDEKRNGAMDCDERGREVARLRAEGRARARFAVLRQSLPEATTATAAECVVSAKEPLRRSDALRRRPGPDPLPVWCAARQTGGGPLTGWR